MRKLCFLALLCFVSSMVAADGIQYASDSSRTSLNNGTDSEADTVKSDSSKLSVRSDYKAAKSWIKFDVSGLDIDAMTSCQLRVTLHASKSSTCLVSAVNDDVTTGPAVLDGSLTWNNAPGNYTSADGINPDAAITLDELQDNLDPALTTLVGTIDYTDGVAGQQFTIDVLSILQADTDGTVQFVLHGSGGDTSFSTHDHPSGSEYFPALVYTTLPTGTCPDIGELISTYADVSCRTELFDGTDSRVNDNRTDSNKLSVRSDAKAAKSWIKFDINDLGIDPANIRAATLRVTAYRSRTGTTTLSAVNDDYMTNIGWGETDITWNNAPGNIVSNDGVNPVDPSFTVAQLQQGLDPNQTTQVGTIDYSELPGALIGDQFETDVLSILQADTDGVVQFVLHNASGLMDFATHDNTSGEEYWPMLKILVAPAGADNPSPCPGDVVPTSLAGLGWTNPDPNDGTSPITCTVYLGTEPNRLLMDSVTLTPDSQGVFINTTNFPNFGNLVNLETYWWFVDCDDPSAGLIPGLPWDFYVNNNEAPVVDAGSPQTVWLGKSGTPGQELVYLDGTTSDDGLPNPPAAYTVLWTQEDNGAPAVAIAPDNVDDTSVTITERGDYVFVLTADDGAIDDSGVNSDTVRIVVGTDPCDASHMVAGAAYDPGDVNQDCIVNLEDFAELIAANWLDCTDTETNCGN